MKDICLIVSDLCVLCLVLFVVSEIPESSRLLCFFLYEISAS